MEAMQDKDELLLGDLVLEANSSAPPGIRFTQKDIEVALKSLDEDNKILFSDETVHKV